MDLIVANIIKSFDAGIFLVPFLLILCEAILPGFVVGLCLFQALLGSDSLHGERRLSRPQNAHIVVERLGSHPWRRMVPLTTHAGEHNPGCAQK
jgi:hypothetical protein